MKQIQSTNFIIIFKKHFRKKANEFFLKGKNWLKRLILFWRLINSERKLNLKITFLSSKQLKKLIWAYKCWKKSTFSNFLHPPKWAYETKTYEYSSSLIVDFTFVKYSKKWFRKKIFEFFLDGLYGLTRVLQWIIRVPKYENRKIDL